MSSSEIISIALQVAGVLLLVLLNGFFVASEFALVKVRDTQLVPLDQKGNMRARIARRILSNLDASLSAAQLGITMASLGLGWIGEPVFSTLLSPLLNLFHLESESLRHSISFAIGFSAITFLHIVAGEQAPKILAIQKPLPSALWVSTPLLWFYKISYPFIWALNSSSQWLLRQIGIEPASEAELVHSEEELRLLFISSQDRMKAPALGRSIVLNAFDLRRRIVREVMRPRREIVGIDTEASMTECLDVAEKTRYSRFPLCEDGDLDRTLGVVHFKDLYAMRLKARRGGDLSPVARKIIFVPETARLEKLLNLFLERRLHFALVVDEYGGTVGMATLENILEELVGQIQDEFDQEKPLLEKVSENKWLLAGSLPLHDLEEIIGEPVPADGISTLSGWITQRLGGFPREGEELLIGRFVLRVKELEGMMVSKVELESVPPESGSH